MLKRRIRGINLVYAILASLLVLILAMPLLLLSPRPAEAQTATATMELKHDDNVPMDQALPGIGGCPSCTEWQGVKFTLPEGVPTAVLTMASVYAGNGDGTLIVYVTDAKRDFIIPGGISFKVSGTKWYKVAQPNIAVSKEFWIWVQRQGGSLLEKAVEPYYDSKRDNVSEYGDSPSHYLGRPPGDFMIRATIVPEVHVGPGQTYEGIQEAIDAVAEDVTLVVHPSIYTETVTVNKRLTIRSLEGSANTTVRTTDPCYDVITITADGVHLSGFTVEGATCEGRAGIRIESSNCTVSSNVVWSNDYGIRIEELGTGSVIDNNDITLNTSAFSVEGSQNVIVGNKIHENSAVMGSAISLGVTAVGNLSLFNSITDQASSLVYNSNNAQEANATRNWWGTAGDPGDVATNATIAPWLKAAPVVARTVIAPSGAYTFDTQSDTSVVVTKTGEGTPVICVAKFSANTEGTFPSKNPIGKWVDVYFGSVSGVDQVEIRVYHTVEEVGTLNEGSLRLYWWNGENWKVCSKSSVNTTNHYVSTIVDLKTSPALGGLSGTLFAVGTAPPSSFAWWWILVILVVLLVLLVAFRLFWVLVVKKARY